MSEDWATGLMNRAGEAEQRGDWQQAYELLTEADAVGKLPGAALPRLASVAYERTIRRLGSTSSGLCVRARTVPINLTLSRRLHGKPRRLARLVDTGLTRE